MPVHQPKHALKKTRAALNALLVPLQIFLRRRGKKRIHARRIATVFLGHIDRAHHVSLDLDILAPSFSTMPCENRRRTGSRNSTSFKSRITLQKNRE